jgi:hypothetical protein
MIITYHQPQNIANLLCPHKLEHTVSPPVSAFLWQDSEGSCHILGANTIPSRFPMILIHKCQPNFSNSKLTPFDLLLERLPPQGFTTHADELNSKIPASGFMRYPIESLS